MMDEDNEHTEPHLRERVVRAKLLQVAEQSLIERGYDGTSLHDVARIARVDIDTLHAHFPDKRALLLELIDRLARRLAAVRFTDLEFNVFLGDDPRAAIERYLRNTYAKYRARSSIYLVALSMSARDDEARLHYQRVEQIATEWLCGLIEYGKRKKLMRGSTDAWAAAFLIHNSLDRAAAKLLLPEYRTQRPDAERVLRELCELICLYLLEPRKPEESP